MNPRAVFLVILAALPGCRGPTMCDRPGRATGQLVQVMGSPAFKLRLRESGEVPPHLACRAETTVPTAIMYLKLSDQKTMHDNPSAEAVDYVAVPELAIAEGTYRVMGIGRGLDSDDCGRAAVQACNDAVDQYYVASRALRPLGVVCTPRDDRHLCLGGRN